MERIPSFSALESSLYGWLESEKPSSQEIALDDLVKSIRQRCLSKITTNNLAAAPPTKENFIQSTEEDYEETADAWNPLFSDMVSISTATLLKLTEKIMEQMGTIFGTSASDDGEEVIDCDNILSWNEIATECLLELNSLSQEIAPYQNKWIRCWDDALIDSKDLSLEKQIKSCLGHFTYFQQLPLTTAITLLSEKPPSYGRRFFIISLISSASKSVPQKISCIKKISDLVSLWEDSYNNLPVLAPTAANQPFLDEQNPAMHAILLSGLKTLLTHSFDLDSLWEAPLAGEPKEVAKNYLFPHFQTINKLLSIAKKHLTSEELMEVYYKLNKNWETAINAMESKLRIKNYRQKFNEKKCSRSYYPCLPKRNDPTQVSLTYRPFCNKAIRKTERSEGEQQLIRIHFRASKQLLAVVHEMPLLFTPENCS